MQNAAYKRIDLILFKYVSINFNVLSMLKRDVDNEKKIDKMWFIWQKILDNK